MEEPPADGAALREVFERAMALAAKGDRRGARAEFGSVLEEIGDPCVVELALLDVEDGHGVAEALSAATKVAARVMNPSAVRARSLYVCGLAEHRLRRTDDAIMSLEEAARCSIAAGDDRNLASIHELLGRIHGSTGQLAEALHHYAMSLVEWAIRGDRVAMSTVLVRVGRVHWQAGRSTDAVAAFDRALDLARAEGASYALACALNSRGEAHCSAGRLKQAEADQREAIALCQHEGFSYVEFFSRADLALCLARAGRLREASTELTAARAAGARIDGSDTRPFLSQVEGEVLLGEGRTDQAITVLESAVAEMAKSSLPDFEVPVRIVLARALDAAGRTADAERCLLSGVGVARQSAASRRHLDDLNDALTRLGGTAGRPSSSAALDAVAFGSQRYKVRERLGGGAFGEVYRAYDTTEAREVALKRISLARVYDASRRDRLLASIRTEVGTASRVDHPGIARVLSIGRTGDGDAFVVQEFVAGQTLRSQMRQPGEASMFDVLRILGAVAQALHALHRAGVVHRDVKPDNIILRSDGQPVLVDLGVAWAAGGRRGIPDGDLVGTVDYMAPEQTRTCRVDGRADLYALGVIAFEWLAGTLPRYPRGKELGERIRQIRQLDARLITEFRKDLPPELVELLQSLLAKRRWRRPRDAAQVANAFVSIMSDASGESTLGKRNGRSSCLPRSSHAES